MADRRGPVGVWSGTLAGLGYAAATLIATVGEKPFSNAWFIFSLIEAIVATGIFFIIGLPDFLAWSGGVIHDLRNKLRSDDRLIVDRWNYTPDGTQASAVTPTMEIVLPGTGHGRWAEARPAWVRFAILVGCSGNSSDVGGRELWSQFQLFLQQEEVHSLVRKLSCVGKGLVWTRWATNSPGVIDAVLTPGDENDAVASARLVVPDVMHRQSGDQQYATLILHFESPRNSGKPIPPAGPQAWNDRIVQALKLPQAFATFLSETLGLATSGMPPASLGIWLEAQHDMTEHFDTKGLDPLRGARRKRQAIGYFLAASDGVLAEVAANRMITHVLSYALFVDPAAQGITGSPSSPPSTSSPADRKTDRNIALTTGSILAVVVAAAAIVIAGGSRAASGARDTSPVPRAARVSGWTYRTGSLVLSGPVFSGGTVYVGSADGFLYALDAVTGDLRWRYDTGGAVTFSPAVAGSTVYVGSNDGSVYALDAVTHRLLWSQDIGNWVGTSPVVADGIAYVGSGGHDLYALNAATGTILWTFPTAGSVESSPVVTGGVVYFGSDDHYVYAINAITGKMQWSRRTGGMVQSSPELSRGVLYVGSDDHELYALYAANGHIRWTFATRGSIWHSSPAVADGTVYIGSQDDNLYAINATSGRLRWRYNTEDPVVSRPAVADGTVYAGSKNDDLYAIDTVTGLLRWQYRTKDAVESSPVINNGIIYFGSNDHDIYALNATTGH
jgi:outer membrane protein assembly factor BamB